MRRLAIVAVILFMPWSAMAQSAINDEPVESSGYHWVAIGAGVVGGVVIAGIFTPVIILPVLEVTGITAWVVETGMIAGDVALPSATVAGNRTLFERVVLGTTSVIGAIAGGLFGDWAYRT